jgi:hypothetical protein
MSNQEKESLEFQNEIIKDLQTNEKYKTYFSKFEPTSVETFITGFAFTKLMYTQYADLFQREREQTELGLLPEALQCLAEIQQKKLFDMQCLWRSGTINIDGITNTFHFDYWEEYIFACPFIAPISESDLDLYLIYLNSTNEPVLNHEFGYQDYDQIKETILNDESGNYPTWYEYYDTYRGTGMNIKLPNVRGQQEEFYRDLCYKNEKEQQIKEGTYKELTPFNSPNYLSYYDDEKVKEFVKLFYSSNELELLENYRESKNNNHDYLDDALSYLSQAKEPISINANSDWREAIFEAAQLYKNKLIAKALPLAFEEYQMKLNIGISFYENIPPISEDDNSSRVNEQIKKGKILNGESPDFDY